MKCTACGQHVSGGIVEMEAHLAEHAKTCVYCGRGQEVLALDNDGCLVSMTGKPGTWGHAYDDACWPCPRLAHLSIDPAPAPRRRDRSISVLEPMEEVCRGIGEAIGSVCDDFQRADPSRPRIGFTLLMFSFGLNGWMTYISNADREDMVRTMKELIEKQPS